MAATAHVSVRPATWKPSATVSTTSRWLVHNCCCRPSPPAGEDRRIHGRASRVVYAARAAGNNHPFGAAQLRRGSFALAHFRIDAQVAHLARLQMAILPPRVQNDDLWIGIQPKMLPSS